MDVGTRTFSGATVSGQTLPGLQMWVRSKNGWVAGVCQGLGEHFGIEVWILRCLWIVAVGWFGTGLLVYFIMAVCLPREDKVELALDRRFLGVCGRISKRYNFDIGLVRFLTVMFALSSLGLACFVYVILYFIMPELGTDVETRSSAWSGHGGPQ